MMMTCNKLLLEVRW